MAKLYRKNVDGVQLGCYSERGLLSYFMFRVLPVTDQLTKFLGQVKFPDNRTSPFKKIHSGELQNVTLFSELDFGNRGFGKPDGAISFRHKDHQFLIMIEVKLNQSYEASCATAHYNSTIRGQLELKWRLMTILKSNKPTETVLGVNYIFENVDMIRSYRSIDVEMYRTNEPVESLGINRRRLRPIGGVGDFVRDFVEPCPFQNIYYLALTDDNANPFDCHQNLRPRCFDENGQVVDHAMKQFCWIDKKEIENWA